MQLIKPIEQYSKKLTLEEIDILDTIGINFKNNRNYFYSRYNGINNLINSHKFFDTKKQLVSNEKLVKTFNLPARYWKIALMNCSSNIKTEWSNTKRKIRAKIFKNENINEEERMFMFSVLKSNKTLESTGFILKAGQRKPKKLQRKKFASFTKNSLQHLRKRCGKA